MKSKAFVTFIGVVFALILLAGTCSAGFIAGWTASGNPQFKAIGAFANFKPASTQGSASTTNTDELFTPFWEAWKYVHDLYVDQPVDNVKLMQGAIKGMMEALGDPHSSYMDPVQYKDATTELTGEYEGIGAWVSTDGEFLTITEPMQGSPAEKAGLLPGDQIIAINGEDMTGILPSLARQKVLGPAGTTVTLTILRKDVEKPFDVVVSRAAIKVASVEGKILEGNVAYIRLRNFGDNTDQELRDQLKSLLPQKPVGLILDLRNNPGGALEAAIQVASEFIPQGVVLYEVYGDGTRQTHEVIKGGLATEIPLVVLVNEFSASASEVVSGAIQDYGRGQLVGVKSFGKGSVQQWIPLSNDQGAVRVTIARWLTPKERQINQVGLTPDVVVERTDEDFTAGRDPQLDKAVELLTQK